MKLIFNGITLKDVAIVEFQKVDFSNRIKVEITYDNGKEDSFEILTPENIDYLAIIN